jgi:hypothetical protein
VGGGGVVGGTPQTGGYSDAVSLGAAPCGQPASRSPARWPSALQSAAAGVLRPRRGDWRCWRGTGVVGFSDRHGVGRAEYGGCQRAGRQSVRHRFVTQYSCRIDWEVRISRRRQRGHYVHHAPVVRSGAVIGYGGVARAGVVIGYGGVARAGVVIGSGRQHASAAASSPGRRERRRCPRCEAARPRLDLTGTGEVYCSATFQCAACI